MLKLLIVLTAAGGIAVAAPLAATTIAPNEEGIATLAHSLVAGVILGSGVWPYSQSLLGPESQAKLLLDSPDCGWLGQCDPYGLASSADRQNNTDTDE
jgi:hypothetical protein